MGPLKGFPVRRFTNFVAKAHASNLGSHSLPVIRYTFPDEVYQFPGGLIRSFRKVSPIFLLPKAFVTQYQAPFLWIKIYREIW
jgi:hypothetical protein